MEAPISNQCSFFKSLYDECMELLNRRERDEIDHLCNFALGQRKLPFMFRAAFNILLTYGDPAHSGYCTAEASRIVDGLESTMRSLGNETIHEGDRQSVAVMRAWTERLRSGPDQVWKEVTGQAQAKGGDCEAISLVALSSLFPGSFEMEAEGWSQFCY